MRTLTRSLNQNPTKLEQARRAAGLTRKELGYLADVSDRTIEGLEQRRRNTADSPALNVLKLARALKTDPWNLIEEEPDNAVKSFGKEA